MNAVIVCFSVALISTMTKNNLREIIFYLMEDNVLSSTSKSSFIIEGSQDGDSRRESEGRSLEQSYEGLMLTDSIPLVHGQPAFWTSAQGWPQP